jgi:ribose-phosphate pyrophosphokinase
MKAKIFSIDGREDFANKIVQDLISIIDEYRYDEPSKVNIEKFADGEMTVQFQEYVRGQKVFLVCSTNNSDNIVKLMLAADAARRASAEEIIAIIPYFGYARQDRKDGMRGAVGAKVMSKTFESLGINRVICVDLHADQLQGFFDIPVDHVSGWTIFLPEIKRLIDSGELSNVTLCSPDAGGVKRVNAYFKKLVSDGYDIQMAMFSKLRDKPNEVARLDLIGDVKNRDVIIIDDMVDTAGTLCGTADEILKAGAKSVRAIITHGILSGPSIERIMDSSLTEVILSDSLPVCEKTYFLEQGVYPKIKDLEKFNIVSCTKQISRIIKAVCEGQSADKLKEIIK